MGYATTNCGLASWYILHIKGYKVQISFEVYSTTIVVTLVQSVRFLNNYD